jgi:UDP-N-acetylglucosamine:LPS N-acetylglucosamine transferase
VPWWFDFQYRLFMDFAPTRWLALRLLTGLGHRGLMRLIRSHNPDVIVSTYPGVTAVLGELRRTGRLKVPCYSSITDLAGMRYWAHQGIDLHFVTHPETIEEVESIAGPGSVRWAKPPTSPSFLAARSRADARRALGLPGDDTKVIAVSGGGWGVGDLLGATREALKVPDALVLCLCGRNDKLRARVSRELGAEPRLRVMGFTDRMGDVLAASDALVHSSAGLTVLEAIIRGCPVISYGFGYGHVRVSNEALLRFGLAQVAQTAADIGPSLEKALAARPEPDGRFARRPATASLIMGNERRSKPLPAWRLRTARAAVGTAAALLIASWTLTTGASYSLVSHFVHMKPVTAVQTSRPEVGVLIDAPAAQIPAIANLLSERGLRASFALARAAQGQETLVIAYGDQAMPQLPNGGLVRWLGARDQLRDLGFHHHFLYASSGPSVGQWFMAHGAGGRLVAGAIRLDDHDDSIGNLHAGEVIELSVTSSQQVGALLSKLDRRLLTEHLNAVPVGQLLRDAGATV